MCVVAQKEESSIVKSVVCVFVAKLRKVVWAGLLLSLAEKTDMDEKAQSLF